MWSCPFSCGISCLFFPTLPAGAHCSSPLAPLPLLPPTDRSVSLPPSKPQANVKLGSWPSRPPSTTPSSHCAAATSSFVLQDTSSGQTRLASLQTPPNEGMGSARPRKSKAIWPVWHLQEARGCGRDKVEAKGLRITPKIEERDEGGLCMAQTPMDQGGVWPVPQRNVLGVLCLD